MSDQNKKQGKKEQKKHVPKCCGNNQQIEFICINNKCNKDTVFICRKYNCECRNQHKECPTFTYSKILKHAKDSQKNLQDMFENTLKCLKQSLQKLQKLKKQVEVKKQEFMKGHCSQIMEFYNKINKNKQINRLDCAKLRKYYDQYLIFKIPQLKQFDTYNQQVNKNMRPIYINYLKNLKDLDQNTSTFYRNCSIDQYNKWIHDYNIEKSKEKKSKMDANQKKKKKEEEQQQKRAIQNLKKNSQNVS